MNRMHDANDTTSWLQRAQPEEATPANGIGTVSFAVVAARASARGWDPFEVWLRRIHEPRQRRGAVES